MWPITDSEVVCGGKAENSVLFHTCHFLLCISASSPGFFSFANFSAYIPTTEVETQNTWVLARSAPPGDSVAARVRLVAGPLCPQLLKLQIDGLAAAGLGGVWRASHMRLRYMAPQTWESPGRVAGPVFRHCQLKL